MTRYITEDERRAYGDEALSVIGRKAREIMDPVAFNLFQQNREIQHRLQKLQTHDVYQALDRALGEQWLSINRSPEWIEWLRQIHPYTGATRQHLLDRAFAAGDAGKIIQMLRDFQAEHGRQPRSSRSSTGRRDNRDYQPIIPREAIKQFYADVARHPNRYTPQQKSEIEAALHKAVVDGRVS
jgi:hypothetical protein